MYCKGTLWKQNSLYSNFEFVVITPTCFCIYRFKCSNAISGWMGMDGWVWKSLWAPLLKAKLMALVLPFALNGTLERLPRVEKGEHLVNLQTSFFLSGPGSWFLVLVCYSCYTFHTFTIVKHFISQMAQLSKNRPLFVFGNLGLKWMKMWSIWKNTKNVWMESGSGLSSNDDDNVAPLSK